MNAKAVEQIEFRWQRGRDFGPIASSSPDPVFVDDWRALLATIAAPPEGVRPGHRSLVYLLIPERGEAAIIERSFDEGAVMVNDGPSREDGGRHAQVARALVGPVEVLGVDLALAFDHHGLDVFGLFPGRIQPGTSLQSLDGDVLAGVVTELDARTPPGLGALVAAALNEPAKPISVLIPGEPSHGPARPGDYLRGLRHTAGRLLEGTHTGWCPSFSTFEAPPGRTAGRLPHVVFRDLAAARTARPTEMRTETRIVLPSDHADGPPQDYYAWVADGLVQAYGHLGASRLATILEPFVERYATVGERIDAMVESGELVDFFPQQAHRTAPAGAYRGQQPGMRPTGTHHQDAHPGRPRLSDTRSAAHSSPRVAEHGVAASAPQRASQDLVDLYQELPARQGRDGFFELVEMICAIARHDLTLIDADSDVISGRLSTNGWYIHDLRRHYGSRAAEQLSWLISPLVVTRLGDERFLEQLEERIAQPATVQTWTQAVMLLYARQQSPHTAMLGHRLTRGLLRRVHSAAPAPAVDTPRSRGTGGRRDAPQRVTPTRRVAPPWAADFWVRAVPVPRLVFPLVLFALVILLVWY
jgi:hypothetical protein